MTTIEAQGPPIEHLSLEELQRTACSLRVQADNLMFEAYLLDVKAVQIEERLARVGLKSFYAGSLERQRLGRSLIATGTMGR